MKKLLSALLCAVMLASPAVAVVGADDVAADTTEAVVDKAMLMDDISVPNTKRTGSMGYICNTNNDVKDQNGVNVVFDLNMISGSPCGHLTSEYDATYRHISGLIFTFSNYNGYQAIIYDQTRQEFQIANIGWMPGGANPDQSYVIEAKKFEMKPGEWHHIWYNIDVTEVTVYVDGEEILYHDFNGGKMNNLVRTFLMFWPSHVRCMMDNLVVGNDMYDDTNVDPETILYQTDFNDACDPVLDHIEKDLPTWEIAKDENGKEMKDENDKPIYVQLTDEDGKPVVDADGNPVYKQAVDDKGVGKTHDDYYYDMGDGTIVEGGNQHLAGFDFTTFQENIQNHAVVKATHSGSLTDSDDAAIAFADTKGTEGSTFTAAVTYDAEKGAFSTAKNLILACDPIFTVKGFENIAEGVTIDVHDDIYVDITVPAGFSGKLADFVVEVPKESEMGQGDNYRYGLLIGETTEIKDAAGADVAIAIDAGGAYTVNFIAGDANGDGKVNNKDLIAILTYSAYSKVPPATLELPEYAAVKEKLSKFVLKAADLYPSGTINARDVSCMLKLLAGLPY